MTSLGPRAKAALAGTLIFVLGAAAGVAIDRAWLAEEPEVVGPGPLTVEALAEALELAAAERLRVQAVLDSIREVMAAAADEGPDSLWSASRWGRRRLEESLPREAREPFRRWMEERRGTMTERMGRGPGWRGGFGRGRGPGMGRGEGQGRGAGRGRGRGRLPPDSMR